MPDIEPVSTKRAGKAPALPALDPVSRAVFSRP
jgi:hypothetical protein